MSRAVSVTLDYVIMLGISTIAIAGLVTGAGAVLDDHSQATAQTELEAIGETLAAEIESLDRAESVGTVDAEYDLKFPRSVAGSGYSISLQADEQTLELRTQAPPAESRIELSIDRLSIETTTISGGSLRLVVRDNTLTMEKQ